MLSLFTNYFHALLGHGPPQHEIVCSRSVNTENKERLFKCAEAAARCTDRKPENMLPGILKLMQCKREAVTDNPIKDLHQRNSRISVHADGLPKYTGSIFTRSG